MAKAPSSVEIRAYQVGFGDCFLISFLYGEADKRHVLVDFGTDGRTGRSGEIIRSLHPKVVLQPWTEDPAAAENARTATRASSRSPKSFIAALTAMQDIARAVYELTRRSPGWMGTALQRELAFLGLENIANESAVTNLIAMGEARGAKEVWAHHGLEKETILRNTDDLKFGKAPDLCQKLVIRP